MRQLQLDEAALLRQGKGAVVFASMDNQPVMIRIGSLMEEQTSNGKAANLSCPECGMMFEKATGLGAHRRSAHGVKGRSRTAKAAKRRSTPKGLAKPKARAR